MANATRRQRPQLRLLIADRSAGFADLLAHALRAAGATEIFKATDSETAWHYLARGYAQAAVLDLAIGPRNAAELVVALRRRSAAHAHIPVIGMTPVVRRDEFIAATRAGINVVLTKPISAEMIVSRVTKLLAEARSDTSPDLIAL